MMGTRRAWSGRLAGAMGLMAAACWAVAEGDAGAPAASDVIATDAGDGGTGDSGARAGEIRVAMLRYGGDRKTGVCFADTFIRTLEHETDIKVDREFAEVGLDHSTFFDYPFAIMTGEGRFTLSAEEIANLRRYIAGGGFLLASAGCSNSKWAESMRDELTRVFPESDLMELPLEHDVFHTVFDIMEFESKKRRRTIRIEGIEIDGRLAVVFSPEGLNDTKNAGEGCCCCGGNEILNARYVNANIMAYALMR